MADDLRRSKSQANRRLILETATEVFGTKNYNWATTKEIAEKAGVSERTIFFYFKSKKELYREVLRKTMQDMLEAVLRATPPQTDIRAWIKMSERNFLTFLSEYPYKVKVLFQNIDLIGDPEIKADLREMVQTFFDLFYNIIEDAKGRAEIREDIHVATAVVYILGFQVIVSFAELLGLDWFEGGHDDVLAIGDSFADYISGREVRAQSIVPPISKTSPSNRPRKR